MTAISRLSRRGLVWKYRRFTGGRARGLIGYPLTYIHLPNKQGLYKKKHGKEYSLM